MAAAAPQPELEFRAVLAPVGQVVLFEGSGSTTREVGRFVVPAR